eukprot:g10159.t1
MGRGRSRSRSRSRSEGRRGSSSSKSKKSDKKKSSSSSSSSKGGGGGRRDSDNGDGGSIRTSRSHSRSRERYSSSSRRDRDRDRDRGRDHRDRDNDRHHRDKDRDRDRDRDRRGSGRSRSGRDYDDDGGGGRDRKRSRGGGGRDGERRGGSGGGGRGDADDMWKRKLADEDQQLKELDLDSLMVDEEEEERRLEEQRRKRKEKLEALQNRKRAEEAAAAAAAPSVDERQSPQSSSNGHASTTNGNGGYNNASDDGDDDDDDDDAGPIEITKQASRDAANNNNDDDDDDDDDESGARNEALIPGERGGTAKKNSGSGDGAGAKGKTNAKGTSSSELRAQQGKEDRPVFDMFSAAALPDAGGPGGKMGGKNGGARGMSFLGEDGGGDQGNWTDVEGYYKTRVGEVIGGRYTVLGSVGRGVFSTVLKCLDTRAGPAAVGGTSEVALKMIRNNDIMRKAAQKEVALLKELAEHDPANKKHCIRLLSSLEHKQHTVMVFESMQMNLRETLKKFGRKTGINIVAVQKYGKQLLAALKHMASRNLVHADIKPDNILVDQGFGSLKLADFGSAFRETDPDNDPTPYLVSRWYRAPEIVMGLDYDKAIDLWSVAVTLFELYKGSPVLPGVNNNEMLKLMMEFKGPVPARMMKGHMRAYETMGGAGTGFRPHFTDGGQFMQQEPDPVTGQTTVRLVTITGPSRPIKSDIMRSKGAQDKKDTVADLADFLDKCMSLDPRQRISLAQCSAHSFLRRV